MKAFKINTFAILWRFIISIDLNILPSVNSNRIYQIEQETIQIYTYDILREALTTPNAIN